MLNIRALTQVTTQVTTQVVLTICEQPGVMQTCDYIYPIIMPKHPLFLLG